MKKIHEIECYFKIIADYFVSYIQKISNDIKTTNKMHLRF